MYDTNTLSLYMHKGHIGDQIMTFPYRKICQGQLRVIINITFVDPESLMFHAKFQYNQTTDFEEEEEYLNDFTIYRHSGHLGN